MTPFGLGDGHDETIQALRSTIEAKSSTIEAQRQSIEALKATVEALRERLDATERRGESLRAQLDQQKKAHAARKLVVENARAVLDDFFESPEPRSHAHALEALRNIISRA